MLYHRTHSARTQRIPTIWLPAVFACATACAWQTQFIPVTSVLMGFSAVTLWDWMIYKAIIYRGMLAKPYIPSDDVRMLEAIANMSDNQLSAAFAAMGYEYQSPPELEPEVTDPEIAPGITKSYAISKMDKAVRKDGYLEPLRSTSEGTPERRRYALFLEWAEREGHIQPAAGNRPARVINYHKTREEIG